MSNSINSLTIANYLQLLVPLISLIAYVPQWSKMVKTRSSKDISLKSWIIWIFSGAISLFYAIELFRYTGKGVPLLITSSASLLFVLVTVYLIAKFRTKEDGPSI